MSQSTQPAAPVTAPAQPGRRGPLPPHELNARRRRKRVLTRLPALTPSPATRHSDATEGAPGDADSGC
jgi:hypothetical protein